MSTSNTSWDDTGFDADDDGFKAPPSSHVEPPLPSPVEPPPPSPVEPPPPPHYTRVEPRAIVPPPVQGRSGRWGKVFLIAALLLIVLATGYIVSTFFMRDAAEQEAFYAEPEPAQKDMPTPPVIDTVAVVAEQVPPSGATKVDSMPRQLASAMPKKSSPVREPKEEPPGSPASASPPANALYVVQVFSSPSRDDADEWLQILRERNIADGFITEQRLGGEAWFRVRFGQYSSRQDAEAAAQRLGFANPWIARVR